MLDRRDVPRQRSAAECGPAALLGVLQYWGANPTLSTVVRMCAAIGPERDRVLGRLARAARALGFDALEVPSSIEVIRDYLPCIVQLDTDVLHEHCVIVYKVEDGQVEVGDPTRGMRRMDLDRFRALWATERALLLRPRPNHNARRQVEK